MTKLFIPLSHTSGDFGIKELKKRATLTYLFYYMTNLIANVTLISLYFIQVYLEHQPCLYGRSGANITSYFDLAFWIGGSILIVEFLNTNCMCIYFWYKIKAEETNNAGLADQRSYL